MAERILVAYASRCGSTAEVAEAIGQVLREYGAAVDVCSVKDNPNPADYDAAIVGSAARCGKSLPEAVRFVEGHRAELSGVPTAYFTVGVAMKDTTPKGREEAEACLKALVAVRAPVSQGLFAGKVDPDKMPFPLKHVMSLVKEGPMARGDFRDWDAIRGWARGLAADLGLRAAA